MKKLTQNIKIAVIGGDERQVFAGVCLADIGYEVSIFGFEEYGGEVGLCTKCMTAEDALNGSSVVILPMPVTQDGELLFMPLSDNAVRLCDLSEYIGKDAVLLGGRVGESSIKVGREIIDYFDREELQIANAYLTAESAVAIAMKECKGSVKEHSVLVVGFGRIGKCLCHILKGMGVDVYASARKKRDFEWIRAYGYSSVDTSKICSVVSDCRIVFNTVPGLVIGRETLHCMPEDCLIIDLASKPGGVDFSAANEYGLRTIWALGLPGKELPKSAGRAVARTVLNILEDKEVI